MKQISLKVKENNDLIKYLINYSDYSRNKIKSLLKYHKIYINNKKITKLPVDVKTDDVITINLDIPEQIPFEIIYEDDELLVVNKPAGLLTIGTFNEKDNTLYRMVREYALKHNFQSFVVHRLDKETSGIVMFAKSERMKLLYQNNWNELVVKRGYIAVVEGRIEKDGRVENLLYEEKNTFVHSSKIGKKAITNYKILKRNNKYTLLDIDIETGRKNQIRVHMSELGYPIVGDMKYGIGKDPIHRMALHAYDLRIKHPISNNILVFESQYPKKFNMLLK